jgi:hypothetical protein
MSVSDYDINKRGVYGIVMLAFILLAAVFLPSNLIENVTAQEVVVIQNPMSGALKVISQPGPTWQGFGRVTSYPKRASHDFETQVRFNDGGHGTMKGSIQYEMPVDPQHILLIHSQYGNSEALQKQIIEKQTTKAIYMAGPLMSSTESYAAKRNSLIAIVEDQVKLGVYKTVQKEVKTVDPITGQEKTVVQVDISMKNGVPERQEESVVAEFAIKPFGFVINELKYDATVEGQITQQQAIAMNIQKSVAEARQAEQRRITAEQNGMANAAQAKWEQEVIKAKEVTQAQQKFEVAKLDASAAEQEKNAAVLRGQGQAEARRLVMSADNALEARLSAAVEINKNYAAALGTIKLPGVVMGGGEKGATGGIETLLAFMTMKAAQDAGVVASK